MNYILMWYVGDEGVPENRRYYVKYAIGPQVRSVTGTRSISDATVFDDWRNANYVMERIRDRTIGYGSIEKINMTDKELFKARLKNDW